MGLKIGWDSLGCLRDSLRFLRVSSFLRLVEGFSRRILSPVGF